MKNNGMMIYYNMESLASHLERIGDSQDITQYEVIEHYKGRQAKNYNFINLKAEVGNEFGETTIMFCDEENTIHVQLSDGKYSTLIGFPESSVMSTYSTTPIDGVIEFRIILVNGYIDIIAHTRYKEEYNLDMSDIDEIYREYYA